MATLYQALDVVNVAVAAAVNANGNALFGGVLPPAQAVKGWPVAEDLTEMLGQQQYIVSVYDHGSKNSAKYLSAQSKSYVITPPSVQLAAIVEPGSIGWSGTFPPSGSPPLNIHTFVGEPQQVAAVQSAFGDDYATISTKIAAAINGLGDSFVTAASTGDGLTVTGSPNLHVNIGSTGTYAQEVGREDHTFQLVVWAPNYDIREAVGQAIKQNVGTTDNQWFALPDGTQMRLRYESDQIVDESQSDYSLYEHHIFFMVELPQVRTFTATQVESFTVTTLSPDSRIQIVG